MKSKEGEKKAIYTDQVFSKAGLSQLSISEIKELRNTDESLDVQQERELIKQIRKNQTQADQYGLQGVKKKCPFVKMNKKSGLQHYYFQTDEANQKNEELLQLNSKSKEKKLSFNKDIRKKKRKSQLSKDSKSREKYPCSQSIQYCFPKPNSQNPRVLSREEQFKNTKLATKVVNRINIDIKKLQIPHIKLKINDQQFGYTQKNCQQSIKKRVYHLMPDQVKFQLYDISVSVGNVGTEVRKQQINQYFRRKTSSKYEIPGKMICSREKNNISSSWSSNGISESYPASIRTQYGTYERKLQKTPLEIKRPLSLDCKRQQFISSVQRGESLYSRDSMSTATQGMRYSEKQIGRIKNKKQGQYYTTSFRRKI